MASTPTHPCSALESTHCAAGNDWHAARFAQGRVHTPHTQVSWLPQVLSFGWQRVRKWVSPPVGSLVSALQLNANASAASMLVIRLVALLSMIFAVIFFVDQALTRVDHNASMGLGNRLCLVEIRYAPSQVGEHTAQARERAEYLVC